MKKKLFFTGMLAVALTFGLILTGCGDKDDDDDGGGGKSVTITITGLTAGQTYYVGLRWPSTGGGFGGLPNDTVKSNVADAAGSVTVEYTSADYDGFDIWNRDDILIRYGTLLGMNDGISTATYRLTETITLAAGTDF
ncbi:MAG: hypothetical protein LBP19_04920 [Treponema sp.]|jgi:hypothetical protein|nr:hypothetical protein [Treponema sp.]